MYIFIRKRMNIGRIQGQIREDVLVRNLLDCWLNAEMIVGKYFM